MELIVLSLMLVLSVIPLAIIPSRMSKALFGLVVVIAGIFIWVQGLDLTFGGTTYNLLNNTMPETYVLLMIMTLGSMMSVYASLTE